jgi:hypothetical protein
VLLLADIGGGRWKLAVGEGSEPDGSHASTCPAIHHAASTSNGRAATSARSQS